VQSIFALWRNAEAGFNHLLLADVKAQSPTGRKGDMRYKMKKLFTLIACAMCTGYIVAGDYFPVKLTVAAAGTTATTDIDLSTTFGEKAMFVERVTASVISGGGTGVVTFASVDHAVATTLTASGSIKSGDLYAGYPARTVSTSNTVLTPLSDTNGALTVISTNVNTVTTSMPYLLKTVRVSVAQAANPVATVYNAVIYVK